MNTKPLHSKDKWAELDEILKDVRHPLTCNSRARAVRGVNGFNCDCSIREARIALAQYIKQKELEARIDELLIVLKGGWNSGKDAEKMIVARLDEIRAQSQKEAE